MVNKKEARKEKKEDLTGGIFVGCILIGGGIGFLVNQVVAGFLLGVGAGFIIKSLVDLSLKN